MSWWRTNEFCCLSSTQYFDQCQVNSLVIQSFITESSRKIQTWNIFQNPNAWRKKKPKRVSYAHLATLFLHYLVFLAVLAISLSFLFVRSLLFLCCLKCLTSLSVICCIARWRHLMIQQTYFPFSPIIFVFSLRMCHSLALLPARIKENWHQLFFSAFALFDSYLFWILIFFCFDQ